MDVLERITQLRNEREWSVYKLAQKAGVSQTTLRSLRQKNNLPTISTLEQVCAAFGITLAQFFTEGQEAIPLTDEQRDMLRLWDTLTPEQKSALMSFLKTL